MSIPLSCPSCNTGFALATLPPARRATCPRCGDVFPVRAAAPERGAADRDGGDDAGAAIPDPPPAGREPTSGRGPRRMALVAVALGAVGCLAGLAAYYARGPKPAADPPAAEFAVAPPAELLGLGYLPAECNVVFAIQPGPLREYAARTRQEPRELLARAGVPDQLFAAVDSGGLPLAQIDHAAGGIFVADAGEPRFALVLVLNRPLADEGAFRTALKARPGSGKQKYDSVKVGDFPLLLARVSPTVWVFGFGEGDFSAVEKGGFGPGGTQFRLRAVLAAIPPDAAVWAAADDDGDWTQKPLVKLLASSDGAKTWLPLLSAGRGAAVALTFGERARVWLQVRTVEASAAERLRAYFRTRAAETDSATVGGDGTAASLDAPFDPTALRRFLTDLKSAAGSS
jgi:hypothetical protein